MSVSVPNMFPPGTRFGEFDGIPITQDQDQNLTAWDVPGAAFQMGALRPIPRRFQRQHSEQL